MTSQAPRTERDALISILTVCGLEGQDPSNARLAFQMIRDFAREFTDRAEAAALPAAALRVEYNTGRTHGYEEGYRAAAAPPAALLVEQVAQIIREEDGDHSLGAGALAERIVARLPAAPELERQTRNGRGEPMDVVACPLCGFEHAHLAAAYAEGKPR